MITKQRRELRPDPPLNQRLPDSDCRGCRQWECLGFTVLGFHGFGISDLGIGLPIVFFLRAFFRPAEVVGRAQYWAHWCVDEVSALVLALGSEASRRLCQLLIANQDHHKRQAHEFPTMRPASTPCCSRCLLHIYLSRYFPWI